MSPSPSEEQQAGLPTDELIRAAKDGDQAALGELLARQKNYLLSIANQEFGGQLSGGLSGADLVQNVFASAVREFHTFRGQTEAQWRSWLRTILRHDGLKHVARHHRQSLDAGATVADAGPTPSADVRRKESEEILAQVVARLPEKERQAYQWRRAEGLTLEETAARMSLSVTRVFQLEQQALKRIMQDPQIRALLGD